MGSPVQLPFWLFLLLLVLALVAVLDRLLLPGVRRYLRTRVNRVVDELNLRLHLKIRPFELTRRQVLIDRLSFDPEVMQTVEVLAREQGAPREELMREVGRYAREIVPAFNPYFYFRIGCWVARRFAQSIYRVRLGYSDEAGLAAVPEDASVVFVMNHRSNMDYILVSYLAAARTALSYAVGEWARTWPLQSLIRSMGAYFIRRDSRSNPLYRRVLERYVAMATQAGVVQALFPEGGLSRDGTLGAPKLGLLSYMLRSFDPARGRDLVFIPVGINYDRVLEDRSLLLRLDPQAPKRGRLRAATRTVSFLGHNFLLMLRGGWHRFGYACVNFGPPLSLRDWLREGDRRLEVEDTDRMRGEVADLGAELMRRVGTIVPALPVALVATVLLEQRERAVSALELKAEVHQRMRRLEERGGHVYIPRSDRDYAVTVGLRMLTLRHLVEERDGLYRTVPDEAEVLHYYANSIAHLPGARGDG